MLPNPVSKEAQLRFTTKESSFGQIELLDINGRQLKIFHQGILPIGEQLFTLNVEDIPAGIYLVRLHGPEGQLVKKIVIE